jgi:hypothetical protein
VAERKFDHQGVRAGSQMGANFEAVRDEHIFCFADEFFIEPYLCNCVQPSKSRIAVTVAEGCVQFKMFTIYP